MALGWEVQFLDKSSAVVHSEYLMMKSVARSVIKAIESAQRGDLSKVRRRMGYATSGIPPKPVFDAVMRGELTMQLVSKPYLK